VEVDPETRQQFKAVLYPLKAYCLLNVCFCKYQSVIRILKVNESIGISGWTQALQTLGIPII